MAELAIEVQNRQDTGKGAARRLRAAHQIPAVLYGAGKDPVVIQVARKTLIELFKTGGHENRIFLLKLAGTDQSRHAMVRDLQIDPVTSQIDHVDFQRIAMDKRLRVKVHIELQGIATGVKNDGGLLDFVTREIEVECLPTAIPTSIPIDVSAMRVGEHIEAHQLVLPTLVDLIGSPDAVIVSIKHSKVEEEVAVEAVAGTDEPEVIARGKQEEDES